MKINFNAPQSSQPLTYYSKASVEAAYKAQSRQAIIIKEIQKPSEDSINQVKRDKFFEILIGVSKKELEEADIGLFFQDGSQLSFTESLGPGLEVTYTCGDLVKLGYTGEVCKFTVHEGKFNLSTAEVANISAAFKDVGLNINPAINLDLLSTAIGEGNVDVGVLVTPRFTSLCFNISIPLKLLEVFEETLSMSIAFTYTPGEMKPPQSPQPQFVFDPLKIGVSNFEKFSQEVLSSFNNLSEMMVITAFLGFTALMVFA